VLSFLVIFLVLIAIIIFNRSQIEKQNLIEKIQGFSANPALNAEGSALHAAPGLMKYISDILAKLGERFVPEKSKDYLLMRDKFLKAGLRSPKVAAAFWGAKSLLAVSFPLIFFLMRVSILKLTNMNMTLAICLLLALAGFYLPNIWLSNLIARRKEQVSNGLPDALDLLVVCVEAGMGLDSALNRVAEEIKMTNKVLSNEFKTYSLELLAGKARKDALNNLAKRTDLDDMKNLITLLIQTEKFGTSISQALRVYSDSFRTARQNRAEEVAAKMPVKLLVTLIVFIFPSLFVVMLLPAALRIFDNFLKG
jgi:tight adherence protein C